MPWSPFKRPRLRFYFGKISQGVPYFLPRRWNKEGKTVPVHWFQIKFLGLGWKTKWNEWDFRHEWDPMISVVFCYMQFCVWITHEYDSHFWECWLAYREADGDIEKAIQYFDCVWTNNNGITTDYWELILKKKYLK